MDRRTLLAATGALGLTAALGLSACAGDRDLIRADIARARPEPQRAGNTVDAAGRFSLDLIGQLGTEKNLLCSPLSVLVALAMVRNGAAGTTAAEFDRALHLPALDDLNAGMNVIDQTLATRSGKRDAGERKGKVELDLANAAWGQQTYVWEQPFLRALAADYGTGVHACDFAGDDAGARQAINAWVADRTHDKITDIATPDVINADTALALVNALYLRAPWAAPFTSGGDQPFEVDSRPVPVPMISGTISRGYLAGSGWTGARIPLLGGELAVTVLRPDGTVDALVTALRRTGLTALLRTAPQGSVDLTLPTVTVRSTVDLKPPLEALGLRTAFSAAAEFPGLTTTRALQLQAAKHMGYLALDEDGVEAAAATVVSSMPTSAQRPEHELVVDRPFLLIVHDVELALPLLVGVIADPRDGSG